MKSSVFPTSKRGDSRLRLIHLRYSFHTVKECLTTIVSQKHVMSIKRHKPCELNMKSVVFPIPKRGGTAGQSETETYLAFLGGNHWLVTMLARHNSKTTDSMILLIHLGSSLT